MKSWRLVRTANKLAYTFIVIAGQIVRIDSHFFQPLYLNRAAKKQITQFFPPAGFPARFSVCSLELTCHFM
jgi:hypothetical protein